MESRLFGLTRIELRRLAYQLAERNNIQHNFHHEMAGVDWLKGFLRRHQNLSVRTPEATSAARAMGFNKVVVGQFFGLLTKLMDDYNFRPTRIYNVDETGLTTVPKNGHVTHTKNLKLIDLAKEHGIIMLCFPPHCTHRLQPLDVSFMGPLSTFYSQEVKTWLRTNPGRVVTQFQVGRLFGQAYARAATVQTAVSGFSKTGIYPLSPQVFGEADFAAAETTERRPTDPVENNADEQVLEQEEEEPVAGPSCETTGPKTTHPQEGNTIEQEPVVGPSQRMSRESTPDPNVSSGSAREKTPEKIQYH
ncbi:unnamed protein product [Acanthoscelides obtectus]|uniref:HTH CENPB-type domain-containing protein n=1 Tax=Acanthoscelides obtectus TaxID=200917 RepID=A0A9P0KA92_ACAOB|nr:unnamed protein product [Acanthoscelides obtectus]CAK1633491.1 hypothetical protein AOBTE_LOCUS8170 [Acanthoscelides obtectus]